MSSEISRTIVINHNQAPTYLTNPSSNVSINGTSWDKHGVLKTASSSWGYASFSEAAKNILFPNSTAHTTAVEGYMTLGKAFTAGVSQGFGTVMIGDNWAWNFQTSSTMAAEPIDFNYAKTYFNANAQPTKSTEIKFGIRSSSGAYEVLLGTESLSDIWLRFYFTRYDFSASAGTGIASVSVSSDPSIGGNIFTGSFGTYYNGQVSVATFDGYGCWKTTTSSNASYTDGGMAGTTGLVAGNKYRYTGMIWAPSGKRIRVGMRLKNGGNTENVYIDGNNSWQPISHEFIATNDMSGDMESVQTDYSSDVYSWYIRDTILTPIGFFDGDSVVFSASLQDGYSFDGWYNGSTKVSSSLRYVHTVSGSDLSLTAKGTQSTIASTKILKCKNTVMSGNIVITVS